MDGRFLAPLAKAEKLGALRCNPNLFSARARTDLRPHYSIAHGTDAEMRLEEAIFNGGWRMKDVSAFIVSFLIAQTVCSQSIPTSAARSATTSQAIWFNRAYRPSAFAELAADQFA